VLQIIGKDILIPAHGIYWLIMLHAIGFPDEAMPQLLVHGWWNLGGAKMSKTAGNVVDPNALADKYSAEALRYYLMSDIATGKDSDFSQERLIGAYNGRLANSLGNLLNRSLDMIARFCSGAIHVADLHISESGSDPIFSELARFPEKIRSWTENVIDSFESNKPEAGCFVLGLMSTMLNRLVDDNQPWVLAKSTALEKQKQLEVVLYTLAESLRIIAILISPVLPRAAHGIFDQLNWKMELSGEEKRFRLDEAKWGGLPDGHVVGKPVPLFPRIEL
jgi:methionyl-tRNA synthetase